MPARRSAVALAAWLVAAAPALLLLLLAARPCSAAALAPWRPWKQSLGRRLAAWDLRTELPMAPQAVFNGFANAAPNRPRINLFVGTTTSAGAVARRAAIRRTWFTACKGGGVVCFFCLGLNEANEQEVSEHKSYGDLLLIPDNTTYETVSLKTYRLVEYAVLHYDFTWLLKTDDDTFVRIPEVQAGLARLCAEGCATKGWYIGHLQARIPVRTRPGEKYYDGVYLRYTGLRQYAHYMLGGGYAISSAVAQALVAVHSTVGLRATLVEDAGLGAWLGLWRVQKHHPPGFKVDNWVSAWPVDARLCSLSVLHKVSRPAQFAQLHEYFAANCTA